MTDKSQTRIDLEARAKVLGLKVPPNIGDEKLEQRVLAAEAEAGQPAKGNGAEGTAAPTAPPTPATSPAQAKAPEAEGPSITVTGPKKGRWRAGRHFTPEPVTIPMSDLTSRDLEALENDPALTVTTVEA